MTLHLLGLPHTQANENYLSCAYTQKIVKFCKMMGKDYPIVFYGGDQAEPEGASETVVCVTEEERRGWFGEGFDTVKTPLRWTSDQPYWATFAGRAIPALRARAKRGDLLLVTAGWAQKPIADALSDVLLPIEWGVGYEGIFSSFCAFESYAWMHFVYGKDKIINGRAFDTVIPNFFDPDDFIVGNGNGGYLLYLGRVVQRKGPHVAGLIAQRLGKKLLVAGPGGQQQGSDVLGGDGCRISNAEYVGEVDKKTRARLLTDAEALIIPTLYIEPFGGVAVEAMLSGCPVVASDWGAFTETVTPDVGRRFRTLGEACKGVETVRELERARIAEVATKQFSLDAIRPRFSRWFDQLGTLWGEGWYA